VLLRAADPAANPSAVPTFECVGLYWKAPGGASDKVCEVSYRVLGDADWRPALPLWFDPRNQEYRGSIVHLRPGATYEIALQLKGTTTRTSLRARTWSEVFPVRKTVEAPVRSSETLTLTESGSPEGYVLYAPAAKSEAVIDVGGRADHCIVVKASYVILRGLTLKNAAIHGVLLGDGVHDVVIEECDISGWGRVDKDGWGVDYDSAVYSKYKPLTRVIIQRNHMHHPRSNANCWQEFREGGERYHPKGPQGISFFESAGNHVFRYNDFMTDDHHYCNDIFGGGANRSLRGFPGTDSDVYGNHIEGCWDDGLELEGGGCNVRVWGNYINRTMVKIAIAGLSVGPIYIFRNVAGSSRFGHTSWRGEPFLKMGGAPLTGGGRAYVFHNTILQPPGPPEAGGTIGCAEGLNQSGGPELLSVVSRNNILHVRSSGGYSIRDASTQPTHDYDYDLIPGKVRSAGKQEPHGVVGVPEYAPGNGFKDGKGVFALSERSPGFDGGVVLPNFNDGFTGAGPDIGAHEAGTAPMEFGVAAYRPSESSGEPLYNGIALPSPWPPHPATWPHPGPGGPDRCALYLGSLRAGDCRPDLPSDPLEGRRRLVLLGKSAGPVSFPLEEWPTLRLLGLAGPIRRQSGLRGRWRAGLFQ